MLVAVVVVVLTADPGMGVVWVAVMQTPRTIMLSWFRIYGSVTIIHRSSRGGLVDVLRTTITTITNLDEVVEMVGQVGIEKRWSGR